MLVYINDQPEIVKAAVYLTELLHSIHRENSKGVAVAVNGNVIPKAIWSNYMLKDEDKIMLIQATQGG